MLLSCTNDYKSQKAAEGNDWESVRTKYGDIQTMFHQCVLDAQENGNAAFKHKPEEITKEVITSKLKNIRIKYREAVDNGRRSGHGRVVMLLFELCESIWGGEFGALHMLSQQHLGIRIIVYGSPVYTEPRKRFLCTVFKSYTFASVFKNIRIAFSPKTFSCVRPAYPDKFFPNTCKSFSCTRGLRLYARCPGLGM